MPGIYNINNIYNNTIKKEKTSLSFKVGETFSARIVSKTGDGNDAKIKLLDGWQFDAEVLEGTDLEDGNLIKFKVEGLEDGKLKLKAMNEVADNIDEAVTIDNLLDSMNLSETDKDLAKLIMKYNIDLSKENIDTTKSLITMNDKIKLEPNFIENFIEKFLEGKGIDKNSQQGLNIAKELKQFFNGLKNLNKEEILFFLENNLDINENSVEAFNGVFKNDLGLYKEISKEAQNISVNNNLIEESTVSIDNELVSSQVKSLDNKDIDVKENMDSKQEAIKVAKNEFNNIASDATKNIGDNINKNIDNKVADKQIANNHTEGLIKDIKNGLESITNNKILITKDTVLDVLRFVNGERNDLPKELNKLPQETKEKIIEFVKLTGKSIDIENEIKNIKESIVKDKIINDKANKIIEELKDNKGDIKKLFSLNDNDKLSVVRNILEKLDKDKNLHSLRGLKEPLESLEKSTEIRLSLKESMNNVKNSIESLINGQKDPQSLKLLNEIKMFNNLSDEYYYMDVPFKFNQEDYGCKIIIKDKRKDGKEIDSTNMKMVVTVDAPIMGKVDGYIHVLNKNMNIRIDAFERWIEPLSKSKAKLSDSLGNLGYNINIEFKEKSENIDIAKCRTYFSDDIWALDRLV